MTRRNTLARVVLQLRRRDHITPALVQLHWLPVRAANDGVPSSPGRYAVIGCKLKQNANDGCNSCASLAGLVLSFIACFILLVIAP